LFPVSDLSGEPRRAEWEAILLPLRGIQRLSGVMLEYVSLVILILQQFIKARISPQAVEDEPEVELAVERGHAGQLAGGLQG
jgi:hypothetical protein